ncbi:MAG: response regulator [Chloroflexota bacterium]|nr:response regulator [Chloroflexota bacterium]
MADTARSKKRILVVEDEAVIRNVCRAGLGAEGFDVHVTPDCRTAQEMINKYHYDLFLVDILIPEMSGMQLYQWLLEKHPQLAKKVVFCTGLAIEGNIKKFLEQSGRPVLPKPFSLAELVNVIQDTLRRKNGKKIRKNTYR